MRDALKPVEFHLLLALSEGPLHGYALARRIEHESDGSVRLLPGNLYAVLRRLEIDGLVRRSRRRPAPDEDRRRRYFELTRAGRRLLLDEAGRMERLADIVRLRLEPALEPSGGEE